MTTLLTPEETTRTRKLAFLRKHYKWPENAKLDVKSFPPSDCYRTDFSARPRLGAVPARWQMLYHLFNVNYVYYQEHKRVIPRTQHEWEADQLKWWLQIGVFTRRIAYSDVI